MINILYMGLQIKCPVLLPEQQGCQLDPIPLGRGKALKKVFLETGRIVHWSLFFSDMLYIRD